MSLSEGKYNRTYHYSFSPGTTSDDRINHEWEKDILRITNNLQSLDNLIHTEKMDGENCLEENTLLKTEFDGYKTIKWICENKYNGKVLCYDIYTDKEEYEDILNWQILENNDDWYEIILDNNKSIILTGNHYVWLNDLKCYRRVSDLKEGDDFLLKK